MATMVRRCQRVKPDGDQCGSPALRAQDFCYYHIRPAKVVRPRLELEDVDVTDFRSSNRVFNHIFHGLAAGTLREDRALAMLRVMTAAHKEALEGRQRESRARLAGLMEKLSASAPPR